MALLITAGGPRHVCWYTHASGQCLLHFCSRSVGGCLHAQEPGVLHLKLDDAIDGWRDVLTYLYPSLSYPALTWGSVSRMLPLADKYAMRHLLDGCTHFTMHVGELSRDKDAPNYVLKWLEVRVQGPAMRGCMHRRQHACMHAHACTGGRAHTGITCQQVGVCRGGVRYKKSVTLRARMLMTHASFSRHGIMRPFATLVLGTRGVVHGRWASHCSWTASAPSASST